MEVSGGEMRLRVIKSRCGGQSLQVRRNRSLQRGPLADLSAREYLIHLGAHKFLVPPRLIVKLVPARRLGLET